MSRLFAVAAALVAILLLASVFIVGPATAAVNGQASASAACACPGGCQGCEVCDCTSCADCVCCDFGRAECCLSGESACCVSNAACCVK